MPRFEVFKGSETLFLKVLLKERKSCWIYEYIKRLKKQGEECYSLSCICFSLIYFPLCGVETDICMKIRNPPLFDF